MDFIYGATHRTRVCLHFQIGYTNVYNRVNLLFLDTTEDWKKRITYKKQSFVKAQKKDNKKAME